MTTIEVDGENASDGLLALVVAVVELLVEAMEREAIRRMESGQLTDDEVERLGQQFRSIETEVDDIKTTAGISTAVDDVRSDLDGLVADALQRIDTETPAGEGEPVDTSASPSSETRTGDDD